ncbi:hypothetical protein GCM10023157_32460 [Gluconacetobacter asukensis]
MRGGTGSRIRLVDATPGWESPPPSWSVFVDGARDASFMPFLPVITPLEGVAAGDWGMPRIVALQEEGSPLSKIESGSSTSRAGAGVAFAAGVGDAGGGFEGEVAVREVWRGAARCESAAMVDVMAEQDRQAKTESVTQRLTRGGLLKGTCL